MSDWPCLSEDRDGTVLRVHAMPGARKAGAAGLHDGALRIRVSARAVEGEANDALRQWVAAQLGIPLRRCELMRGTTSRRKQLLLRDVDAATVARWLDGLVLQDDGPR